MHSSEMLDSIINSFSVIFMGKNFLRLLQGLLVTIEIAAVSVVFSIILGFLLGALMTVKIKPLQIICKIYLEFMRIMPQLVLLFLAYFGLTRAFGISISGEAASVLVFTLWGTAEMGDLVRGALESIPRHQYESAKSIGLNEKQIYIYVIIPQTLRRLIPLAMNLITRMIKTTSLVVLIGVIDVVKVGQQIIETSRFQFPAASFWIYGFIFFLYFIICYPLSKISKVLEKKWS